MQKKLLSEADGYLARKRRRRIWMKVVSGLACVVVFCTTYALILPAITMENTSPTERGLAEDSYAQAASEQAAELICSRETLGVHTHSESCFDREGNITCGYADFVVHTHNSACYDWNGALVCSLPQIQPHIHTDDCYRSENGSVEGHTHTGTCYETERGELICRLEELAGHAHTEGCYDVDGTLICQLDETEGHLHRDDCYESKQVLICKLPTESAESAASAGRELACGKEEIVLHTHSSACFHESGKLICGKIQVLEHVHSEDCFQRSQEEAQPTLTRAHSETERANSGVSPMSTLPGDVLASGTFGENNALTWSVTVDDAGIQTLTISGSGDMPDFGKGSEQPWRDYYTTVKRIVVEDGVTSIGKFAFTNCAATQVTIGKSVASIGYQAFGYMPSLVRITIPGNVKRLESAFMYSYKLKEVTLEERIESIDLDAFWNPDKNACINTIHIPASVQKITGSAGYTEGYAVAEGNTRFYHDEYGALYEWNDDTHQTATLKAYPTHGAATSYTVPENVTAISATFRANQTLQELTIPNTVTSPIVTQCFREAKLVKVTFGNEVKLENTTYLFNACSDLEEVTLPDTVTSLSENAFANCASLRQVTIGEGIGTMLRPLSGCVSLEELTYNAVSCTNISAGFSDGLPFYHLTIGAEVDSLPGATTGAGGRSYPGFSEIAAHAESVTFAGPNQITIAEGALNGAPGPLNGLSGTVYVDARGVVYQYDVAAQTARVVYCPDGLESVTIPASIQPETGVDCKVTAVGASAFTLAQSLRSVTFDWPENITAIGSRAFYGCQLLSMVNGKEAVEEAERSFPQAKFGQRVFEDTALTGAGGSGSFVEEMDGQPQLTIGNESDDPLYISVSSSGQTMTWRDNEQTPESGGYCLLTGDTLTVNLSTGNTQASADRVYRVYFELTEEDGALSVAPGKTYTFDGHTATCHATGTDGIIYLEFSADIGGTISIPVTASYPSPHSGGGGLRVWGTILSRDEAEADDGDVLPADGSIQAYWTTKADSFTLDKTSTGKDMIPLTGDGSGAAVLASELQWSITLKRSEDVSSAYGKDYVRSIDYEDTLTLPEGVSWKPEVLAAIRSGAIRRREDALYAGNFKIAVIKLSGGAVLSGVGAAYDEGTGLVTLRWRVLNPGTAAEIPANTIELTVPKDVLSVDLTEFQNAEDSKHTITNEANATVHYTYSGDAEYRADASKSMAANDATIKTQKTATPVTYFGEDILYILRIYNDGAADYTESGSHAQLVDTMSEFSYITPENMEKMFREEYGAGLTVQIQGATLAGWQEVTGIDGEEAAYRNSANSALQTTVSDLTVTWNEAHSGFVAKAGDTTHEGATVAEALKGAGYAVNREDQYILSWSLGEEAKSFVLKGGENRYFNVYATTKDTFQMLTKDWPNEYSIAGSTTIRNQMQVRATRDDKETPVTTVSTAESHVKREAYLEKSVWLDGVPLPGSFAAKGGDVLDYRLSFRHYGSGVYENLPMVDDLYGAQYLLVPKAKNPNLKGFQECERDGIAYYILTPGTYENVVVGVDDAGRDCTAATITVERTSGEANIPVGDEMHAYTGLHTQIKWYFPQLSDSGDYQISVDYSALVDLDLMDGVSYTIGNVVWMNDKPGSRIYDGLWGGGTIIDFDKSIVTERGSTPGDDALAPEDYSLVSPGEGVTYRLELTNQGNAPYDLPGSVLADALPNNADVFTWVKNVNVAIQWQSGKKTTKCTELDQWTIGDSWNGVSSPGQQYILWPEDAGIHFEEQDTVYLYVTLTFPEDTGGDGAWSRYCTAIGGGLLENTLYVYRFPANVTHNLRETGQVLLQKGVFGTYRSTESRYTVTPSRRHYNNKDLADRTIAYYVALYNGGNKRFYLDDLYDRLPQGFTYRSLLSNSQFEDGRHYPAVNRIETGTGSSEILAEIRAGGEVSYRSATVTAQVNENGLLQLQISGGSGAQAVKYDETERRYYLDRGEAIVFGYLCEIGETSQTEDSALNTVGMAYYDALGTGAVPVPEQAVTVNGPTNENHADSNDGSCRVTTGEQASDIGLPGGTESWLISDVTVTRGGIDPGVTKYTESYTQNGQTTPYTNSAPPDATVNWRVRLHNAGTLSLTDYTVTDTMPAPYSFEGEVSLTIYDDRGRPVRTFDPLLTIGPRTGGDTLVPVRTEKSTADVALNGEFVPFSSSELSFQVSLERDAAGSEIMKLKLDHRYLSIPEGGYADLTLSSRNPTGNHANTVYINQAMLTPNGQQYDSASHGTLIRDDTGKPMGVRNSAPVNVSFGYATSSLKRVEELENPENYAVSTDPEYNYILLSGTERQFRYTLTVSNDTEEAMTKLVLIDSLPEIGDHSPFNQAVERGSEFRVALAQEPQFTVKVIHEDGKEDVLQAEQYKVEYRAETSFTADDWSGANAWENTLNNARAIRITILDDSGTLILSKARVEVSFQAAIEGPATPGAIAWNSFGYHYGLQGIGQELEAMPLVVGVKVPEIPALQKQLTDANGNPMTAPETSAFDFLVYEGERLSGSYATESELTSALTEKKRKFARFTLKVDKGNSCSEAVPLIADGWSFEAGKTYTVVELPVGEDYAQDKWNNQRADAISFVYQPGVSQTLICVNVYQKWALQLYKVDSRDEKPLSGAVFALYSPDPNEKMNQAAYNALSVKPALEKQADGTAWYLTGVETTTEEGGILWDNLHQEQYYLEEIQAPAGYHLNWIARPVSRGSGTVELHVTNTAGYELPDTGGAGTLLYTFSGIAILASALMYDLYRRRRGGM